ncbi:hypothetical protein HII31_02541 [Pseudocercospora fuligena]|uniref:Uncharacterized protein n=1 Tax=Pseudocercospora fuligena TaxID=685502 RepID=A0A8H6RQK5_9PEZI|nr:hypothetical protein HII31_02541 [Pseudocercospora fuligena]
MFKTKKGSENWEWRSKDELKKQNEQIMEDREPKFNKRRSQYRPEKAIKPVGAENESSAATNEDTKPRPKIVIRRPSRETQEGPAAKKQKRQTQLQIVQNAQTEPDSDVQMTGNDGASDQKQYINALLQELTTRENQVKALQQQFEQQKQTIDQLTTASAQSSMNASADVANRNQILKANNVGLQKQLQASENRNTELEEENQGLRAAYEALLDSVRGQPGAVPNHEAIMEAVKTTNAKQGTAGTMPTQPRKCQGFTNPDLFEHTKTFLCENLKHSPFADQVSCSACTEMAISISDPKGQEIARSGGIGATICQRCCWDSGEHLKEQCKCMTANRCTTCVVNLVNKMAEDAKDWEGMDLEKCPHCGKRDMAEEEKVKVCVTCGGRREE